MACVVLPQKSCGNKIPIPQAQGTREARKVKNEWMQEIPRFFSWFQCTKKKKKQNQVAIIINLHKVLSYAIFKGDRDKTKGFTSFTN